MAVNKPKAAVGIILAVWVIVAALSFGPLHPPLPPEWLKAWTQLVATVAAAAVGVRVLWVAPEKIQELLDK